MTMARRRLSRLALGWALTVFGLLSLVFGLASLFDVFRDLLGTPTPAGKDYDVGPLFFVLGGILAWKGLRIMRRGGSSREKGSGVAPAP